VCHASSSAITVQPVSQTKRGGPDAPPEERGDCWPACLASLLEVAIEECPVPHSDDPEHHWYDATNAMLARHDCEVWCFPADAEVPADYYWIAGVPSLNLGLKSDGSPVPHVIVMRGDVVAHDPSLGRRYAIGTHRRDIGVIEGHWIVPRGWGDRYGWGAEDEAAA
jgi:hypothetical protein